MPSSPSSRPSTQRRKHSGDFAEDEPIRASQDVRAFLFDLDGDQKLDFDEWHMMQPAAMREHFSPKVFREWFDQADVDKSGNLSLNEFFLWSLTQAGAAYGTYLSPLQMGTNALGRAFESYDTNSNGHLDYDEFLAMCQHLGFSAFAKEIFQALDTDHSGALSYAEMVQSLTTEIPTDLDAKGFLTALVCSLSAGQTNEEEAEKIDTSTWHITGSTFEDVRAELQKLLRDSGARVADLIT